MVDLCEACEAKGVHDMNHTRLKIAVPTPARPAPAARSPFQQQQAPAPVWPSGHGSKPPSGSNGPPPPPVAFGMLHVTSGRPAGSFQ
jgi:hypothetical protein